MPVSYRKALILLGLVLSVLAIVTYLIVSNSKADLNPDTVAVFSNPEGEAPYTDLNGNSISLDQYLGSILVVTTWASWSPFSTADIATLRELHEQYKDEEIVFMAINRKETKEQAARFVTTLPSLEGLVVALDPRDAFYSAVGGYAMPEVVIYNQEAEIVEHFRGVAPKEAIQAKIEELLQQE
jgi:thiol-disulfide isomerase/thioredoxin